jgi:hypothetical protein
MIQITPQMKILVAIEAVDGRKGIDSLARLCEEKLATDPFICVVEEYVAEIRKQGCLARYGACCRHIVFCSLLSPDVGHDSAYPITEGTSCWRSTTSIQEC